MVDVVLLRQDSGLEVGGQGDGRDQVAGVAGKDMKRAVAGCTHAWAVLSVSVCPLLSSLPRLQQPVDRGLLRQAGCPTEGTALRVSASPRRDFSTVD